MRLPIHSETNEPAPVDLLHPQDLHSFEPEPRKKKKKFFFYFVLIILIAWSATCSFRHFSLAELPNDASAYDPLTLKPKKVGFLQTVRNFIFHDNNFLQGETGNRINILLLGMGGPGHDGPFLTDTSIILSVKPDTKEVAMISVPRDLGVKIDGHGIRKINNANAYGEANVAGQGGEYARQIFAETFNLDIPYYIRVDFAAFEEMINTVGGLTINVEKSFVDTQYPGPNHSYQTIQFEAGPQLMNGERSLEYARSRHGNSGEGSDFARSKRQQQILTALKEKLLSIGTYTNPVRIQKIIDSLSAHINTNLSFGQMMYLASLAREVNGNFKTLVLDDSLNGFLTAITGTDGAYLVVPKTGNFDAVNDAIKNVFDTPGTAIVAAAPAEKNPPVFPTAKIEVQNGTWRVGLASREERRLEDKGFTVTAVGNSLKRPVEKTAIYLLGASVDPEILTSLKKEYNTEYATELPDWLSEEYDDPATPADEKGAKFKKDTDILIILGPDIKE